MSSPNTPERHQEEGKPRETAASPQRPALQRTADAQRTMESRTATWTPAARLLMEDAAARAMARIPAARSDQEENERSLEEARKSSESQYYSVRLVDGKMVLGGHTGVSGQGTAIRSGETVEAPPKQDPITLEGVLEKRREELGGDQEKTYQFLVESGKEFKNDPAKIKAFVAMLISMLNHKYDHSKAHDKAGNNNAEILNTFLTSRGDVKNLICGPIAEFVVNYLNEIGVDAALVVGHQVKAERKRTEHYVVMYKASPDEYVFMGGPSDNFSVSAPNSQIALQRAFRLSNRMASSGYVSISGTEKNETYNRFVLPEAAFEERIDRFSDQQKLDANSFLNSVERLDSRARSAISEQIAAAKTSGIQLHSISVEGFENTSMETTGNVKVTFAGINANGESRVIVFDTIVAADHQKMAALWEVVAKTYTETMALQVERKDTGPTDSFDSSQSLGIRGHFEQAIRAGDDNTHVVRGEVAFAETSGESMTYDQNQKNSDFHTFMLSYGYKYIRTVVNNEGLRLNLWVGGDLHATLTQSEHTRQVPPTMASWGEPSENSGGGLGGSFILSETAGVNIAGESGKMAYRSNLSFTLLNDGTSSDPSRQKPAFQLGYRINHSTGIAYNLGNDVNLDGGINVVYLRTPVFDKQMARLGIGVSVMDIGGAEGVDVRFDTGAGAVREGLDISSLGSETLRNERTVTGSGAIRYRDGRHQYGLETGVSYTADAGRNTRVPAGYGAINYALFF
jgi:hypothetical protein